MGTFEARIRNVLDEIDTLRTPECLDSNSIGKFAEGRLASEEKQIAEEHLLYCLYCLKQLNDMKALLYCRRHPTALSPKLIERLRSLCPDRAPKND